MVYTDMLYPEEKSPNLHRSLLDNDYPCYQTRVGWLNILAVTNLRVCLHFFPNGAAHISLWNLFPKHFS